MGCAKSENKTGNKTENKSEEAEEIEAEGGFSLDEAEEGTIVHNNPTYITPISILKSKEPIILFYSEYRDCISKDRFPSRVEIFQDGYLTVSYTTNFYPTKGQEQWNAFTKDTNWPTYGELAKMNTDDIIARYKSLAYDQSGTEHILHMKNDKIKYSIYGISDGTGNELAYEILGYKGEPPKYEELELPDPYYDGIFLRSYSAESFPIYDSIFIGFFEYNKYGKDNNYEGGYYLIKAPDDNTFTAMDELGAKGMEVDPEDYGDNY